MMEPDGLPSMGSHRDGHDWSDLAVVAAGQILAEIIFKGIELEMSVYRNDSILKKKKKQYRAYPYDTVKFRDQLDVDKLSK